MSVLVVGSIAIDNIKTQVEEHTNLLGGSASYASISARFFHPTDLVGIVGSDFPNEYLELFRSRDINLDGLEIVEGKTFRWSGEYEADLNKRQTLHVELNVFEKFNPNLPELYRTDPIVLLGNISPTLQRHVLDQVEQPRFIIADTMDLWITTTRPELMALVERVDLLVLNDSEARQLTEEEVLLKAARKILMLGPKYVAIKKGEHGCLLFSATEYFSCAAFPLEEIRDPTGAGDTFAGGFAGYLASLGKERFDFEDLKRAVVHGSLLASYCVESFSLNRLCELTPSDLQSRYEAFKRMSHFE
jgi:sugar/nucleoside kinase (ribokinase family)